MSDVDFERALQNFASDRDTFFLNLDFDGARRADKLHAAMFTALRGGRVFSFAGRTASSLAA